MEHCLPGCVCMFQLQTSFLSLDPVQYLSELGSALTMLREEKQDSSPIWQGLVIVFDLFFAGLFSFLFVRFPFFFV